MSRYRNWTITLDGKTNTNDAYFVNGIKHNFLSVGQLMDKGYQMQFGNNTCYKKQGRKTT